MRYWECMLVQHNLAYPDYYTFTSANYINLPEKMDIQLLSDTAPFLCLKSSRIP